MKLKSLLLSILISLVFLFLTASLNLAFAQNCTVTIGKDSYPGSCQTSAAPDNFPTLHYCNSSSSPSCTAPTRCCYAITWPTVSCSSKSQSGLCVPQEQCSGDLNGTSGWDSTNPTCSGQGLGGCCYALAPSKAGALDLNQLNQTIFGKSPTNLLIGGKNADYTTPRGIISALLPFILTLAGLILFVMFVWGGFEMLTGAANPKSQEAGKQRLTAAIIGFIIIFGAYWLAQIVQTIFGVSIL